MTLSSRSALRRLKSFGCALLFPGAYALLSFVVQRVCFLWLTLSQGGGLAAEVARNRAILRYENMLPGLHFWGALLYLLFLWLLLGKGMGAFFAAGSVSAKQVPMLLALGVLLNLMVLLLTSLFAPASWSEQSGGVRAGLFGVLYVALAAPILEEIVFRGFVFHSLRRGFPPRAALFWQALLFGAFHFNPAQFLYTVPVGLILGILYRRYSMMAVILVHTAFNICSILPLLMPSSLWMRGFLLITVTLLTARMLKRMLHH